MLLQKRSLTFMLVLAGWALVGALAGTVSAKPAKAATCSYLACNSATHRCEGTDATLKCSNLVKWGCTFTQEC